MTASARFNASADLALAVYLEPHAERRRVLLLGGVDAPLTSYLEGIADHLDVIDPASRDPGRGEVPELPFDDESFDLIIVTDADALPEPRPDAVRELHRTLSRDGLLVATRIAAAGGSSADGLARMLSEEFRHVRVLSETPMFGYALRDPAAKAAELSLDTSLVGKRDDRPERVIVAAAEVRFAFEPRLWVQVPAKELDGGAQELDPRWVESLRKAEDEARRALSRESQLLRELSKERKAREAAELGHERLKALERKLLAVEADYDDAVGRVRYFEGLLLERESFEQAERDKRELLADELAQAQLEASRLAQKLQEAEAEIDVLQKSAGAVGEESAAYERRLAELGAELSEALRETKQKEAIARDLLEELRGLEQRALSTVEHDAKVKELEAERERAVTRALEAEVARESAQMRADELRAQLVAHDERKSAAAPEEVEALKEELEALRRHYQDEIEASRQRESGQASELHALRGERTGLLLRLRETEQAFASLEQVRGAEGGELDARLAMAEARAQAAIEALSIAEESVKRLRAQLDDERRQDSADAARAEELEALLGRAERRIDSLERELEEADRFAEEHADDIQRIEALEAELRDTRDKLDAVDDEVRALQDELFAKKQALAERDAELAQANEALSRLREESGRTISENETRAAGLAEQERALREEREAVRASLAEAQARAVELADQARSLRDERDAAHGALAELEALREQRDTARASLAEAESRAARLAGQEQSLRDERDAAKAALGEAQLRLEQLGRREHELGAEREDAHAALAEARTILAHLAARVGADTQDLSSIMQALDQKTAEPSVLDTLRRALEEAQSARSDAEYQLSRLSLQLSERDARIRELEEGGHTREPPQPSFEPPEV